MTTINGTPATGQAATLENIRENILIRIREVTANPKPNYSIDGQQVSWQGYLDSLMRALREIDEQIQLNQDPYEEVSRGIT